MSVAVAAPRRDVAYWEARASAVDPGGPVETYRQIVATLDEKAENAARRNKPTMWAYYGEMADWLREYFADVSPTDAGYAGAALALVQRAEDECPTLPRGEAAELWARSVYCRRILNTWTPAPHDRPSLQWLRDRASREVSR
jgi:hypothetical protein